MKAIKKNFENLKKVCEQIVALPFSCSCAKTFVVDYEYPLSNSIRLVSVGRDGIGVSILSMIPSNYKYRVNFENNNLYLTICF